MNSIKNQDDTQIKYLPNGGLCENCHWPSAEILEVTYTTWKQVGPDYMTPDGTQTDLVCDNCFDEDY